MAKTILFTIAFFVSIVSFGQTSHNRTELQAKQIVDSLYIKLTKGADFKSLARKYSEDPGTNKDGGKYPPCKVGSIDSDFEGVVLKLKLFEISKPFKTTYGYHIAQLLKKQGATYEVRHILITYK